MEIALVLVRQNIVMLVYLMIGYVLYRKKMMTDVGSRELSKLLLYVVMPVAIMRSYIRDFSVELLKQLAVSALLAALALLLSMVLARLLFRREQDVEIFGTSFSNAGFIGIPLVQMSVGDEGVFFISAFVTFLNILQWTYGVFLMTGDTKDIAPKKIFTNPMVFSAVAGLALFFAPVQLPEWISGMLQTIGGMNGPLAMIILGCYLAQIPVAQIFTDRTSYKESAIRLVLIPAATMLLFSLLPWASRDMRLALMIVAAAPVGANVAIFAQLHGRDYTQSVKEVCLSTLLCIVTLPILLGICSSLW